MARIRTIKPEFPQSETIGRLSRDARLLFVQLWTIVDDDGRARAASRMLASLLYPYDDDAPALMDGWLGELVEQSCIRLYTVEGKRYLDIPHWKQHQKVDHPRPSRLPEFREDSREVAKSPDTLAPDLGPSTLDLGPCTRTKEVSAAAPRAEIAPIEKPDPRKAIFDDGLRWLASATQRGEQNLRPLVGKWIKARGDPEVASALVAAQRENPVNPVAWIEARLKSNGQRKPSDLDNRRASIEAVDEVVAMATARQRGLGN